MPFTTKADAASENVLLYNANQLCISYNIDAAAFLQACDSSNARGVGENAYFVLACHMYIRVYTHLAPLCIVSVLTSVQWHCMENSSPCGSVVAVQTADL